MAACTRCGMELLPGAATCLGCGLPQGPTADTGTPAAPVAPVAPVTAPSLAPLLAPPFAPPLPPQPADGYAPPPPLPNQQWGAPPPQWGTPPPGGGWQQQPRPSSGASGLAIASLVLSILWFLGAGSLAAVIMATIDRRQAKEAGQNASGVGMAGLIIGYIGLAGALFWIFILVSGAFAVHHAVEDLQHAGSVFHATSQDDADARSNLRNLATAEETFLTDNGRRYTNAFLELSNTGFTTTPAWHDNGGFLEAGYTGSKGYCLVGAGAVAGTHWFLYDSQHGGMQDTVYSNEVDAERACADPTITDFQPVG